MAPESCIGNLYTVLTRAGPRIWNCETCAGGDGIGPVFCVNPGGAYQGFGSQHSVYRFCGRDQRIARATTADALPWSMSPVCATWQLMGTRRCSLHALMLSAAVALFPSLTSGGQRVDTLTTIVPAGGARWTAFVVTRAPCLGASWDRCGARPVRHANAMCNHRRLTAGPCGGANVDHGRTLQRSVPVRCCICPPSRYSSCLPCSTVARVVMHELHLTTAKQVRARENHGSECCKGPGRSPIPRGRPQKRKEWAVEGRPENARRGRGRRGEHQYVCILPKLLC